MAGLSDDDSPPLRVLWLIKGLGPGGAEQLLVNQARVTDHRAVRTEAAYLVPAKHHRVPELESAGVAVTCLHGEREVDPRWAWRLRRRLRRSPVDVVAVHSPYVAAVTRLLVRTLPGARRPALVTTEHNRWPRHRSLTRWANRLTFALDDHHVAVSAEVVETIPRRWRDQVEVLHHGVDVDAVRARQRERTAVRAELGIGDDEVVIGTVANLRREKAYPDLLAAAAVAVAAEPRIRVVAVGQGPCEAEIRALHAELGLGERVLLLGYQEDAVRTMAGFDVFTLASRHEGLPVALMDALVLGLPVAATSVGGIPQAVTHDREGLLVPAGRPDLLAEAFLALAGDAERRADMGRAAAARGPDFDAAVATRRLEEIYREAAARRRS